MRLFQVVTNSVDQVRFYVVAESMEKALANARVHVHERFPTAEIMEVVALTRDSWELLA